MIMPNMPEGYYLMQEDGRWVVLKIEGPFMKRLLDKAGQIKHFESATDSPKTAAEYAQKHRDAGLDYDQEGEP